MRKASTRWHTIWAADMRPQRRALSGSTSFSRRRTSALSLGRARVFTARGPSLSEEPLAAGLAERGQRAIAAPFRHRQDLLEPGIATQRVEVAAAPQRRGDERAPLGRPPPGSPPPPVL